MSLNSQLLLDLANKHPSPSNHTYAYGTAGFRSKSNVLDSVLFRVGLLAVFRSQKLDGKAVGVMITASHNPECVSCCCLLYAFSHHCLCYRTTVLS